MNPFQLPEPIAGEPMLQVSLSQLKAMLQASRDEAKNGGPTPGSTAAALDRLPVCPQVTPADALERAASHCDALAKLYERKDIGFDTGYRMGCERAARDIRTLAAAIAGGGGNTKPYGWVRTSGAGAKGAPLFVLGESHPNAEGFWGDATYTALFDNAAFSASALVAFTEDADEEMLLEASQYLRQHNLTSIAWKLDGLRGRVAKANAGIPQAAAPESAHAAALRELVEAQDAWDPEANLHGRNDEQIAKEQRLRAAREQGRKLIAEGVPRG